jgi:hypothetical protein
MDREKISATTIPGSEEIGTLQDGTCVYLVDGAYVRDNIEVSWIGGGHGFEDDFIPEDEIWVENEPTDEDSEHLFIHEITEYLLMRYGKMAYDQAHEMANSIEAIVRGNDNQADSNEEKKTEQGYGKNNPKDKAKRKTAVVMKEFAKGKLKDSSGKVVTNQKQAVAIALSEARKKGAK